MFQPTRDVMVQYHVTGEAPGPHRSDTVRMYFTAGGTRIRIEPVGQPAFSILDRTDHHMIMVMEPQRIYMEMAYDPARIMAFDETTATFSRVGSDTVAGIACTVYDAQSQGRSSRICLSSDGVLLRAQNTNAQQGPQALEATAVTYGPQPASLFMPPPGFQKLDIATMARGMPGGSPSR